MCSPDPFLRFHLRFCFPQSLVRTARGDYYLPCLTSVYSQSIEIRESIPVVIAEAEKLGYHIDEMTVSGGSAGHCLAMLYAYRDTDISPVPVRMVFGAVAPSCFYPEDWDNYGFDQNTTETNEAAAGLFGIMAGKEITTDLFGTPAYDEAMKDISVSQDTRKAVWAQ